MEKGMLLLALGHPCYGKMAAALSASIRCMNATIPIALIANIDALTHLSTEEKTLFTQIIYPESKYYTTDNLEFSPLKPRVYLNELTPFSKTLSIDVDNLWIQGN